MFLSVNSENKVLFILENMAKLYLISREISASYNIHNAKFN